MAYVCQNIHRNLKPTEDAIICNIFNASSGVTPPLHKHSAHSPVNEKREGPTCSLRILLQPEHFMCIRKRSLLECCRFNFSHCTLRRTTNSNSTFIKTNRPPPPPPNPPSYIALKKCLSIFVYHCANQR